MITCSAYVIVVEAVQRRPDPYTHLTPSLQILVVRKTFSGLFPPHSGCLRCRCLLSQQWAATSPCEAVRPCVGCAELDPSTLLDLSDDKRRWRMQARHTRSYAVACLILSSAWACMKLRYLSGLGGVWLSRAPRLKGPRGPLLPSGCPNLILNFINFVEYFVIYISRVWNLVSDIKGGTQTEGVWEKGAEENIWTEEG
jgi:hypothetical protein